MILLSSLLTATLILTPIILLMLLFVPLMDKKYSAVGRYWMWLLIMVSLFSPFATFIPRPIFQIDILVSEAFISQPQIPDVTDSVVDWGMQTVPEIDIPHNSNILAKDSATVIPETSNLTDVENVADVPAGRYFATLNLSSILLYIWLAGISVSLIYQTTVHFMFRRHIRRWSATVTENELLASLNEECKRLNVRAKIELRFCKGIQSPMLAGLIKPLLLLPESPCSTEDLPFVFRHELTHYIRRDLWYKLALMITRIVYWFNPAVYMMAAQANKDIETVCDSQTVNGMDMALRKRYSEVLLSMATAPCGYRSQLTTCFTGGKNVLKQRFANIFCTAKKKGTAMFAVIGIIILTATYLIGCSFTNEENTNTFPTDDSIFGEEYTNQMEENAKQIAENAKLAEQSVNGTVDTMLNSVSRWTNVDSTAMWSSNTFSTEAICYENLDELKALVYDEAKVTEREFDNISVLYISTAGDSVRVARGGDKLFVRYYEWLENECSLNVKNGNLTISQNNIPFFNMGDMTTNSWFIDYLRSQGKQPNHTIEIIIPASLQLDIITIDTASGRVNVQDCGLIRNLNIDTASGQADVVNCKLSGDMAIDTASGHVSVKGCEIDGNIIADTASGQVNIVNCSISGDTSVDTASGRVDVESCTFGNIEISTSSGNGNIKLAGSANDYNISFDSLSGQLTYNGSRTKNMRNHNAAYGIEFSSVSGSFSINDAM